MDSKVSKESTLYVFSKKSYNLFLQCQYWQWLVSTFVILFVCLILYKREIMISVNVLHHFKMCLWGVRDFVPLLLLVSHIGTLTGEIPCRSWT